MLFFNKYMKILYCDVNIFVMRKKVSLVFGMVTIMVILFGCSPQTINNNNPEAVLKNFDKDVENGDFKDAVKLLNPDTVSSRGKIWAQRWVKLNAYNVQNITAEDIGELGGTAKAKVKILYKDGKTKEVTIDLLKNNGTWYISPSFSFKEGK
jgi:hypothetical protein